MPIKLSFSTINATINEPHTYLCRLLGLEQIESEYATQGKVIHKVIQNYVSGKEKNPMLEQAEVPLFPIVEERDFDERLALTAPFNEKYALRGFVDGREEDWSRILEIKSGGKLMTPGEFARSPQWKLYSLMNDKIKEVALVAVLRDIEKWQVGNIKVYRAAIEEKHRQEAREFVEKGIQIIEHIKEYNLHKDEPSRWCWFVGCPFCHAH